MGVDRHERSGDYEHTLGDGQSERISKESTPNGFRSVIIKLGKKMCWKPYLQESLVMKYVRYS